LIQKALDKDGKNLFKQADKDVLMREVDPNIIIRICTELNAAKDAASGTLGN
jgi:hypothetical protein